jgi:hypothetical protein
MQYSSILSALLAYIIHFSWVNTHGYSNYTHYGFLLSTSPKDLTMNNLR